MQDFHTPKSHEPHERVERSGAGRTSSLDEEFVLLVRSGHSWRGHVRLCYHSELLVTPYLVARSTGGFPVWGGFRARRVRERKVKR